MHKSFVVTFTLFVALTFAQDGIDQPTKQIEQPREDPCIAKKCKKGQECILDDQYKASCQCIEKCNPEWSNFKRSLCVDGSTYKHECDFNRNKCYCDAGTDKCGAKEFDDHKATKDDYIQYYDSCRDLSKLCSWESEKGSFPSRLSLWFRELFNIKWAQARNEEDTDDNPLLSPMSTKTRNAATKVYTQGGDSEANGNRFASYFFCALDIDGDAVLTKRELSKLSQLLLPSTPCLENFLTQCGSSGSITADGWNSESCFNITQDQVQKCTEFNI